MATAVAVALVPPAAHAAAPAPRLAYATARWARFRVEPRFVAPGPPIDARAVRGKRVAVIPLASALPYQQLVGAGLRAAARRVGIVLEEQPADGFAAQWAAGVERAVAAKADLIALVGAPDPLALQPQLRRARAARIPVVVADLYDEGTPPTPNVTARMDLAGRAAQRLAADVEIAWSRGRAATLVVASGQTPTTAGRIAALQSEYASVCGAGCSTTVVTVPLGQWSSRIEPAVRAALLADPAITLVHAVADGMAPFVVAGIKAAGAERRVRIGTVDGSPAVLARIASGTDGGLVLFDVGTSLAWHGWADLDVILRALLRQPVPRSQNLPLRVFDRTNVAAAGAPPRPGQGYGAAYAAGYERLWGLAP